MGVATTIELAEVRVTVGVDTHADVHVAAAIDQHGRLLGTTSVQSTAAGHTQLTTWARGLGVVDQVGVEGTGSYGAGLTRHLLDQGISVVEVVRPNRQTRRRRGKTDAIDAETAARSVLAGTSSLLSWPFAYDLRPANAEIGDAYLGVCEPLGRWCCTPRNHRDDHLMEPGWPLRRPGSLATFVYSVARTVGARIGRPRQSCVKG